MKNQARRAFSILLASALLLGAAPQGAFAQVARVAIGETGSMPVTPVGNSVSGMTMAPALSLGAATLNGSLSAPSVIPSPVVNAAAVAAAVAPAGVAVTPALAVSPLAAAATPDEGPKLPETPKAATPVVKKTWTERLGALIGRGKTTPPAVETSENAEAAQVEGGKLFDGSSEKESVNEGTPVSAGKIDITRTGLKAAINNRLSLAQAKRKLTVDEFGGPLSTPMSFKQKIGYGLRQGLHLVGIAAILDVTLKPILSLFPWPQYLSDTALRGFGRVALLTKFGPNEIVAGLSTHPLTFLGVNLPMAVTMEELTYRLLGFGLTFLMLAAIKPVTRWLSTMVEGLPDAAGVVGGAKRVLKIGDWLSHFAFPIAAVTSSYHFATAHFATWGFSPFILALNLAVGLFLAHTAYKSRSLTAPIVAHLFFNLVTMGSILVAMMFSPMTAAAFTIIAGLLGVSSLVYSYLNARKERAFRLKHGASALIAILMLGGALTFGHHPAGGVNESVAQRANVEAAYQKVQDKKAETAPKQGPVKVVADTTPVVVPADTAKIESREDMVARVKPAVVNPIIHMANGYALGSGFILTPNGIFITNGHVVGTKEPGEFINARVPGVDGELKAKVLAVNHDKDLAIVQLQPRPDGKPWPTVKLASEAPREGQEVTALGFPRGLGFSVSHGVISAVDGRGTMYVKKLQTDAAINPGNSGGPLFNNKGEVVGVNTEIYSQSGGSEGLGFSIQASEVARIMDQFAKTGNIATASLGIIANLSDPVAPDAGLEIEYVRHGSAAEAAGLKRGDLIIGVGDASIDEGGQEAAGHIASVLSKIAPGEKVTVTVLRGDDPVDITLVTDAKTTVAPSH